MIQDSLIHTQVGPYAIEKLLGSGGVANVYLAKDTRSGENRALKVIHDAWSSHEEMVQRFQQEAKINKTLQHPHIVPVHDYGMLKGRPFMAMTYLTGGTLAQRFAEPSPLKVQDAVKILRRIGGAVDYAHRRGVIHRDLKLENILLDQYGNPYLSDFGLARVAGIAGLTVSGTILGTPLYMSPEQALGQNEMDHRTDLYSLAVIAYLLAVGKFPFDGADFYAILHQHVTQPLPLPSSIVPHLPPALDRALLKALSKHPDDRFDSADMLVEHYARALEEVENETLIDLKGLVKTTPEGQSPVLQNMAGSAQELYEAAQRQLAEGENNNKSKKSAIGLLKQALALEPFHMDANRLLLKLESVQSLKRKASSTGHTGPLGQTGPLKQTGAPKATPATSTPSASARPWWWLLVVLIVIAIIATFIIFSLNGLRV